MLTLGLHLATPWFANGQENLPATLENATLEKVIPFGKATEATATECGFDDVKLGKVTSKLNQFADDHKIAGAVIAIARSQKLVVLKSIGWILSGYGRVVPCLDRAQR